MKYTAVYDRKFKTIHNVKFLFSLSEFQLDVLCKSTSDLFVNLNLFWVDMHGILQCLDYPCYVCAGRV